jgi:hypothetical protein
MKAKQAKTEVTPNSTHEATFVAAFVVPDKRSRYLEFLPKPKRRGEILNRWNHFFDFIPDRSTQIPRASASELAHALRQQGAGRLGYVIGDSSSDGQELPLEDAIESALDSGWGAVVSCIPGRLALYLQEFPPGDAFILNSQ